MVAALEFVVLAICEGISEIIVGVPIDSPAAVNFNNGYGVCSMLQTIPSMIGGIPIIRKHLLDGSGRWSVFFSGVFMVFVVAPLQFKGRTWKAYLALTRVEPLLHMDRRSFKP